MLQEKAREANITRITLEHIERYASLHGRGRCEKILAYLGKLQPKYKALNTEIGREIFEDAISMFDALFEKGVTTGLNDDERAKYSILRELLGRWSDTILRYERTQEKLIGGK